jgi:hypothetical protein
MSRGAGFQTENECQKKFQNPLTWVGLFRSLGRSLGLKKSKFISPKAFSSEEAGVMGFCRFLVSGWSKCLAEAESFQADAHVAQLVERVLGKDEVISSSLIMGSIIRSTRIDVEALTEQTEESLETQYVNRHIKHQEIANG